MKIEVNDGCTTGSIIVDGKNIDDLNESDIIDYLLPKIKEGVLNHNINIRAVIELFQYEEWRDYPRCEQCGDIPYTIIYDI